MTLLVFGMDGAVREYVEEAIDRGLMPNMERFIDEGMFSDLESSDPPITIPAWPSMFSGMKPDKFSTFHMTEMDENYSVSTVSSERWKDLQMWNRLDGEFGLINVPGTSPAYKIEGYMIEGFPIIESSVYPQDLVETSSLDLKRQDEQDTRESRRKAYFHNFEQRLELFDRIDEDVDVRVEVFQLTDTTAHRSADLSQVLEAYEAVDEALGKRMSEFEDVLIVSDHGFTHVDRMFYTNVFLKEHGYLSESSSRGTGASSLQNTIKSALAPLAETSLRPALKLANDILRSRTSVDFSPRSFEASAVDFQNTEAFSYRGGANNYGEITINDSRFEEGTVSDRKEKAQEVASDLRGEDLVENVWLREQLYEEPEGMPDIVFKVVDGVGVGVSLFSKKEFETDAFVHSETGILAARGPSFGSAPEDARLEDVAPTVAHYIGQELECDGERMEIFSEDFSPENIAGSDVSGLDV